MFRCLAEKLVSYNLLTRISFFNLVMPKQLCLKPFAIRRTLQELNNNQKTTLKEIDFHSKLVQHLETFVENKNFKFIDSLIKERIARHKLLIDGLKKHHSLLKKCFHSLFYAKKDLFAVQNQCASTLILISNRKTLLYNWLSSIRKTCCKIHSPGISCVLCVDEAPDCDGQGGEKEVLQKVQRN